jgi:hypothetical protein
MSAAATQAPTLYEDWLVRRDRLAGLATREGDRHRSELRLLEFLLEHYRGSPVAERPARFPARSEFYVDRRAIVVHNHLGKGYLTDMHTRQQAEQRVRAVLGRMTASEGTEVADRPIFDPSAPPSYDETLEAIRGRLCEGDSEARLLAIVSLGQAGTLDDIGLVSDLLALFRQDEDDPIERHYLLIAMKNIVRRLTGQQMAEVPVAARSAELPEIYEPLLLTFYLEPRQEEDWTVIGSDWASELRVNAAGEIHSFDPFGEKPRCFVNSSVRQLARSIKEHREFIHPLRQSSEVRLFRNTLQAIDAKAFSGAENWWALVIERMLAKTNTAITRSLPKIYEPLLLTFFAVPRQEDKWSVIGNDSETEFRVDSAGAVYSIDPLGEKPKRFVNSSVQQLARFIEVHQAYVHPLREKGDQQSEIKSLRYRLEAIDPNAFSSAENWWVLVIERMQGA